MTTYSTMWYIPNPTNLTSLLYIKVKTYFLKILKKRITVLVGRQRYFPGQKRSTMRLGKYRNMMHNQLGAGVNTPRLMMTLILRYKPEARRPK